MWRCTIRTMKNVSLVILVKTHTWTDPSPTPTLRAVFFKLPPPRAKVVAVRGLLPFRHAAHRLQKVASLMREGRPALHPSLSSSPSFRSPPIPNLSAAAVSLSWLAAEGGARGGHVGVISLQQMTALRESVTLCRCPMVANYPGSSTGGQSARPRANALHVGH